MQFGWVFWFSQWLIRNVTIKNAFENIMPMDECVTVQKFKTVDFYFVQVCGFTLDIAANDKPRCEKIAANLRKALNDHYKLERQSEKSQTDKVAQLP